MRYLWAGGGGFGGVGHWRDKLSPAKRRVYDRSDTVTSIPLLPGPVLLEAVRGLQDALGTGDRRRVARLAQHVADALCQGLRLPVLRVVVQGRRPSSQRGELHGLYTPGEQSRDTVRVWMNTAKRGQVVAFRTFLRTLVHEICHHLDYALLGLTDSYHTEGFFMRESGIVRSLTNEARVHPTRGATVGDGGPAGRQVGAREPGSQG